MVIGYRDGLTGYTEARGCCWMLSGPLYSARAADLATHLQPSWSKLSG
jgi:hypothetical protein